MSNADFACRHKRLAVAQWSFSNFTFQRSRSRSEGRRGQHGTADGSGEREGNDGEASPAARRQRARVQQGRSLRHPPRCQGQLSLHHEGAGVRAFRCGIHRRGTRFPLNARFLICALQILLDFCKENDSDLVNAEDKLGRTALYLACEAGNACIAKVSDCKTPNLLNRVNTRCFACPKAILIWL